MAEVLIVAKTHMGWGICLGGLLLKNCTSLRLLPASGFAHPKDTSLNVGDVWDLSLRQVPTDENVFAKTQEKRVVGRRYVRTMMTPELQNTILQCGDAPTVHPSDLFDRRIRINSNSKGFVYFKYAPEFSTGFWRFKKTLYRQEDDSGEIRYLYCHEDVSCDFDDDDLVLDVKYVGCERPIPVIPAGTILRFSLTRKIYRNRHWLQLSGWFL